MNIIEYLTTHKLYEPINFLGHLFKSKSETRRFIEQKAIDWTKEGGKTHTFSKDDIGTYFNFETIVHMENN